MCNDWMSSILPITKKALNKYVLLLCKERNLVEAI